METNVKYFIYNRINGATMLQIAEHYKMSMGQTQLLIGRLLEKSIIKHSSRGRYVRMDHA